MNDKYHRKLFLLLLILAPSFAFAHIGTDGGTHHQMAFFEGFVHPFTGLDHLIAMILVGVWSALNTRKWWIAPITFASLLFVGAIVGMNGVTIPAVEYIVAGSLLVLGIMVAIQLKLSTAIGAIIVGLFAMFHGLAHGSELSHSFSALVGMVVATAILHLVGLGIGYFLFSKKYNLGASKVIGWGSSMIGVGLLTGLI